MTVPTGAATPFLRNATIMLAAVTLILGCLLWVVLDSKPLLDTSGTAQASDRSVTHRILQTGIQPGVGDNPHEKKLVLTAEDITAASNFILSRKRLTGRAVCEIHHDQLSLQLTVKLPTLGSQRYINLSLTTRQPHQTFQINRLKLGSLTLPYPLGDGLASILIRIPPLARIGRAGEQMIKEVKIENDQLRVTLNWNRDLLMQTQGSLNDLADQQLVQVYQNKLADIVNTATASRFVRLGRLTQGMFELAKNRSSAANADPIAENRAIIIVLAAYSNGKDIAADLPGGITPQRRGVLLNKRIDTAQHFLGSAALAMSGQGALVETIGLAKELHDTHDGSGFSFIDLAADQAGALFGKNAIRSHEKALRMQDIMSRSMDESQFIPRLKDLPESMNAEEFTTRFHHIGSPAFNAIKQQITDRINALTIYQAL
jgi:hypothetical protein